MPRFHELIAAGIRWDTAGDAARAVREFTAALAAANAPAERAEAACRLAHAHRRRCEWDEAIRWARESEAAAREAGLANRRAEALNAEATVYLTRGEFANATALFEEVLALSADNRVRALALLNLGGVRAQQGDLAAAARDFTEAHTLFGAVKDVRGEAFALNSLGRAALDQGNPAQAREALEDALSRALISLDVDTISLVTVNLADVMLTLGELERAGELVTQALGGFRSEGNRFRELECLRLLGDIARAGGRGDTAERHYRRGVALAEEIGAGHELTLLQDRLARNAESAAQEQP